MRQGMRAVALTGVAAIVCLVTFSAGASPITYIFRGTATGSLDSIPFTDTAFTFTFHGDTENLENPGYTLVNEQEVAPSTIAVAGHPPATVISDTRVFGGGPSGAAGFGDPGGDIFILGESGNPIPELAFYDMATPIGPVAGPLLSSVLHGTLETDLGTLVLASFGATGTFQAVPEPSIATFLAGGLGATLVWRTRRRA